MRSGPVETRAVMRWGVVSSLRQRPDGRSREEQRLWTGRAPDSVSPDSRFPGTRPVLRPDPVPLYGSQRSLVAYRAGSTPVSGTSTNRTSGARKSRPTVPVTMTDPRSLAQGASPGSSADIQRDRGNEGPTTCVSGRTREPVCLSAEGNETRVPGTLGPASTTTGRGEGLR